MGFIIIFVMLAYLLVGIFTAFQYWDEQDDKEKEIAEKGTTCIVFSFVTFLWPIRMLYLMLKK